MILVDGGIARYKLWIFLLRSRNSSSMDNSEFFKSHLFYYLLILVARDL